MPPEHLPWAVKTVQAQMPKVRLNRNYYDGEHRLPFVPGTTRPALRQLLEELRDNLCSTVVDIVAERLEVQAFTGAAASSAWEIWDDNEMLLRSADAHTTSLAEGDSYVIVWPDQDNRPRLWPQLPDEVVVAYDRNRPGTVIRGAKIWCLEEGVGAGSQKRYRLNLYYPDKIERWATPKVAELPDKPERWKPWEEDEDGQGPELENRWGEVPVFHLPNGLRLGPGRSELKNVIPLQDALNKAIIDMVVGMESVSLPQRYATGVEDVEPERDEETGQVIPGSEKRFRAGPNNLWTLVAADAQFGQFPQADLEQLVAIQDSFRRSVARVTGNPVHLLTLTGEFPSGESLKTAESRLVKKCRARQAMYGGRWKAAMRLALRMAGGNATPDLRDVVWETPETRSELLEVQVAEGKQRVGVSRRQTLLELGYGEETITRMEGERDTEAAEMGEAMLRSFDRQPGARVPVGS